MSNLTLPKETEKKQPVQVAFDYSALTEQEADVAKRSADIIKLRMRRTAEDIVEIGRELKAVKEALPHGKFLPWIEAEFGMDVRASQRFMQAFDKFGKSDKLSYLRPSVIYELSAPSTPEPVIAQATAKAETGETVTVKDVQEWKAKALQNEKLLRMSEQQRIEAEQALKAEKEKPPAVKEIVKEVVPSDYQKLKDDQAALAKALQDTKLVLSNVRNEQERLVHGQVQERLDLHKNEIRAMESRRINLEKAVKELQSQKEKMDARLDSLSHQEHVIDSLKKALFQFSIDIGEIRDVSELADKWENLAVQMGNGAIVIRHMINGQSEPEEEEQES